MAFLPINRRKFIRLAAAAGVAALAADSALLEPNRPQLVRQDIALQRWPTRLEGFTIALLSDFHYDSYFSVHPIRRAVAIVNQLHPDLIALTGDFVSVPWFGDPTKGAALAEPCAQLLRQLHAPSGLWAVLGNHDVFSDAERVTSALHAQKIPVLSNRSVPIERNGARFWLSGVDDVLSGTADLAGTLHTVPPDEAAVLLAHEPDYADYVSRYPVDLQLSGHSHGGQVRFPFIRPLYLPDLAKKYVRGLYNIGGLTLYTNAGIGTVQLPVRFNCPPEITLLTLRRSTAH
ncbi:MAG TPA: metallophosphoesterase [Candidatus Dormibacteraeota bacterium]|nr:metallophosphoesterase [Candidatus Dormibacteraeota bacterium]